MGQSRKNKLNGRSRGAIHLLSFLRMLLAGEKLERRALAQRLGVGVAAADHLINAVEEAALAGIKIAHEGRRRYVRFEPSRHFKPLRKPAVIAACCGASLGSLLTGSSYERGLVESVEAILGLASRPELFREWRRKFVFLTRGGEVNLAGDEGPLDDLLDALLDQEAISFEYMDFEGTIKKWEEIEPLSLAICDHQLYLLGFVPTEERVRTFRYARLRSVAFSGRTFRYPSPEDYEPKRLFEDSLGIHRGGEAPEEVCVRLHRKWLPFALSHRWHASQTVEQNTGAILVRLRVRISPEVEQWVLGFGQEAEVVSPAHLRERIAGHIRSLAEVYGLAVRRAEEDERHDAGAQRER
jgi:predicted DNA-binding transcriptional regulator YafY